MQNIKACAKCMNIKRKMAKKNNTKTTAFPGRIREEIQYRNTEQIQGLVWRLGSGGQFSKVEYE